MTFAVQCGWAAARGLAAGAVCLAIGVGVRALVQACGRRARRRAWALLLIPYLTPALLVGYAYSDFSLSLVHHPAWNEIFYNFLLWMKLVPVAALVLYVAPAALPAEAVHCRRLLRRRESGVRSAFSYLVFLIHGPLRAWGAAFVLVFLLAFGEFEMASLLGVRTWTVTVFDAHAGGLAVSGSLRLAMLPVVLELGLLAALLLILFRSRRSNAGGRRRTTLRRVPQLLVFCYLAAAAVVVTGVPAVIVFRGTARGFRTLLQNFVLAKDIAAGVLFAGAAAACTYLVAGWVVRRGLSARDGRRALAPALCICVPGLLGPLVLSVLIVSAFQAPGLRAAYDGPLPLLFALCLVLFPFALLLRVLLHAFREGGALHSARLLGASSSGRVRGWGRRLVLDLKTRREFWVAFLLFCWGYFDLTASSILAPPGMTPVSVRLYNLMHYGQNAVLSAMVLAAFCTPVVVILLAGGARGLLSRSLTHG